MILAGDIGGTHTRLALFEEKEEGLSLERIEIYPSRGYPSLSAIVDAFADDETKEAIDRSVLGVAGPVRDGRSEVSNLEWVVEADRIASVLGVERVALINDLEANAYGIASLSDEDLVTLNEGEPDDDGNEAIVAAGTGLGEAGLHWEGGYHRPIRSEGGHVDFAPRDETEIALLRYLMERYGRVSYERVVSGPGLFNIYGFLRDTGRADEPEWLAAEIRDGDASPIIAEHGLAGRSELCVLALDLFVSVYGAEAGNLALKLMASAGVYLGGGIAPKILPKLEEGTFMKAFTAKGRMRDILELIPVRVIRNDRTALLGAARRATLDERGA